MASGSDFFTRLNIVGGQFFNNGTTESHILSAGIQLTVDQASEIQFALHDPNWEYIQSFGEKGPLDRDATYEQFKLRVTGYSYDGGPSGLGGSTIKLQPAGIVKSRKIVGPLIRENISPTQFVIDGARSAGMACIAQDSPVRPSINRDIAEATEGKTADNNDKNEWTTLQRLAAEEGFLIFEVANTLFFGSPQWLFDTRPNWVVGFGTTAPGRATRLVEFPSITMSSSKNTANEMQFKLPLELADQIMPGHSVTVMGVPKSAMGEKKLLVTSCDYPLAGLGDLQISAREPWVIEKQALESEKSESGGGGATAAPGAKFKYTPGKREGDQAVDAAMEYVGMRYSWGGGSFTGPTTGIRDGGVADSYGDYAAVGFDCSGITQYAVYQGTNGRVKLPRVTYDQRNAGTRLPSVDAAQAGDLILMNGDAHIALAMGGGKMIESPQSGDKVKVSNVRGGYAVRVI